MAYNLVPVIQIVEQILHPRHHNGRNWILDPRKKPSLVSLLDRARFVEDFFENTSTVNDPEVRRLECRTRDAACRLLCSIESLLADLFISEGKDIEISPPDYLLQLINCEFEGIVDSILEIKVERKWRAVSSLSNPTPSNLITSTPDLNPSNIVVGISQDLEQLKDRIIMPHQSQREIIPIVGMGGIGKTTLARTLYDDKVVASYFDKRAWIVISQSYDERQIMLGILRCIIGISGEISEEGNLALRIYQILIGRKYLIVLDDMWSIEAWKCISQLFPKEDNGSRILVTTREQGVANKFVSSTNLQHKMKLLNDEQSWELLRKKVFPEGRSCEAELEVVGRNIAKGCKGLPLTIHVVGGFLSRLEHTHDAWNQVAVDITSLAKNDAQVSNILSLSYNHLPNYLKPCFLYLGAFREDCVIKPSRVIRLWMAEGFLKAIPDVSLEETGRAYLKELVERNLLSVGQ